MPGKNAKFKDSDLFIKVSKGATKSLIKLRGYTFA